MTLRHRFFPTAIRGKCVAALITRQELQERTRAANLRARIATDDMLTGGTLDGVYEQLVGSGFVSAAGGGARAQLLRVNVEARHTRARASLGSSSHARAFFSLAAGRRQKRAR